MKTCVTCKHYENDVNLDEWLSEHLCLRAAVGHTDPVTGKHYSTGKRDCRSERHSAPPHCGEGGAYWEAK